MNELDSFAIQWNDFIYITALHIDKRYHMLPQAPVAFLIQVDRVMGIHSIADIICWEYFITKFNAGDVSELIDEYKWCLN